MVELFRDEGSGRCRNCGHRFPNPKAAFGCAKWCPQAKECVGLYPPKVVPDGTADRSLAARLIQAVEKELADDPPRLAHALLVFQHAKHLLEREGGDPRVVLAAVLLLPLIPGDLTSWDSTGDSPTCLLAGSPIARQILREVGYQGDAIRGVCQVMWAFRTAEERNTLDLQVVSDAQRLTELTGQDRGITREHLEDIIRRDFHTSAGKQRARELFTEPSH